MTKEKNKNRKTIAGLILLLLFVGINASADDRQTQPKTYYYELVKVVDSNKKEEPRSGDGQFYTFTHNTCYESNRDGMDEGLGHLSYLGFNSERQLHIYDGTSYYGKETTFYFTKDYSRVNIRNSAGMTYVLSRKTAPNNFTASNHKAHKQEIETILNGGVYVPPIQPIPTYEEPTPRQPKTTIEEYDCPSCFGSGDCPICHGKGYTTNPYTGKDMKCPSCHHGRCSACQGTGKKKRIKH